MNEVTVADLVSGWDDLRALLSDPDPDRVCEAVSLWPRRRLAMALAVAVTVIGPDTTLPDTGRTDGPVPAANGRRSDPVDGGQASGHVAGSEWPS